jgi:hypothetical protein
MLVARDGRAIADGLEERWPSIRARGTIDAALPREGLFELVELVARELDRQIAARARLSPRQTMRRLQRDHRVCELTRLLEELLRAERAVIEQRVEAYTEPEPEPELERLDDPAGRRMSDRLVRMRGREVA